MKLSVILPVLNEENNLAAVYERILPVMAQLGADFEIIFVDDGSTDGSLRRMEELCARDARIRMISLSRNFGHQAALTAGMDFATGDAVIHMDADLQHPPEVLRDLVAQWRNGYEVVYTIRQSTDGISWVKRITERFFY